MRENLRPRCASDRIKRRRGWRTSEKKREVSGQKTKSESTVVGPLLVSIPRRKALRFLRGLDAEGGYEASWTANANCKLWWDSDVENSSRRAVIRPVEPTWANISQWQANNSHLASSGGANLLWDGVTFAMLTMGTLPRLKCWYMRPCVS